ncbi:MAG TPA: N-acetylmannosamine-6-phosphate 2-epimerase [Bacteroidota bacterium]|nr:N-acetylmannosamine-6-phosphate 2-epimerase [Bacteroidota bacterium]
MTKIRRGLIVSCQAEEGSPFNSPQLIAAFAKAAELGGAVGVRVRDPENVRAVTGATELPIIGLTKGSFDSGGVLITPTLDDVLKLLDAGADIIAVDATARRRPNGMSGDEFLRLLRSKVPGPLVADISNLQEGLVAAEAGADYVATTLSGYVGGPLQPKSEPDYRLIEELTSRTQTPVIAEGRIWSPQQASRALSCGAFAVCIGSAITRPVDIVRRFVESISGNEGSLKGS